MRILVILLFWTISTATVGQSKVEDLNLLKTKTNLDINSEVAFKGALKVYNKLITDQILNDCIYEHSCSEFSQGAFNRFGLIKGFLMTCDRLMRCNRATLAETSRFQLTRTGRIKDDWDEYQKPD